MALRDVKEYFKSVEKLYEEVVEEFKPIQQEAQNGNMSEEEIERINQTINPIVSNYSTLAYVMFLYNKPKSKKKQKAWERENAELQAGFERLGVDEKSVIDDCTYVLTEFKKHLPELVAAKEKQND